ncbi:hypothetical protein FOE78_18005 [Microlunatus elymi]|uniref:Uncharacterized protein n=1 Tax=Microlunatus elymi TaxID=2596828 RepID=A0A516Q296_9ACTN|nr:hypothetical protein [Microlunatus elymi]QDP97554.1 hypothetical protein FOE78_18005 [Microlunatus elymi]
MPTYTVRDGDGNTISEVAPNSLLRFLNDCSSYAELSRDDWPGRSVLARPSGEQWQVEIVNGTHRLVATTPNVDATLDVMRAWAESDGWWAEAFTWRPVS